LGSTSAPTEPQTVLPNLYQLSGPGIRVSFTLTDIGGGAQLTYQDAHRSIQFNGHEIRTVDVPDLGTVVSATLVVLPDVEPRPSAS
jgi:hypothetical protein